MRFSTTRSPATYSTRRYGPVPIIALPELKSSVFAVSATDFGRIITATMSFGSSGCGLSVFSRSVSGSTALISTIGRTKKANEAGLFGTFGTRLKVAITSSAVKFWPLWNFTPLRSLISHSRSLIAFHDSARPGCMRWLSSCRTRVSNTWRPRLLFGVRLWKCGSSDVTGVDSPIVRSAAWAEAPSSSDRMAAPTARWKVRNMGSSGP